MIFYRQPIWMQNALNGCDWSVSFFFQKYFFCFSFSYFLSLHETPVVNLWTKCAVFFFLFCELCIFISFDNKELLIKNKWVIWEFLQHQFRVCFVHFFLSQFAVNSIVYTAKINHHLKSAVDARVLLLLCKFIYILSIFVVYLRGHAQKIYLWSNFTNFIINSIRSHYYLWSAVMRVYAIFDSNVFFHFVSAGLMGGMQCFSSYLFVVLIKMQFKMKLKKKKIFK